MAFGRQKGISLVVCKVTCTLRHLEALCGETGKGRDWSSRMLQSADSKEKGPSCPHLFWKSGTSPDPQSKDVVTSILFVCISVLVSKNLIYVIPLEKI